MLSRVADSLLWMSRYLERAEHIARILDVGFHLELDLHHVDASSPDAELEALMTILQLPPEAQEVASRGPLAVHHWLTFDLENSFSIVACINRARNNARSIRGTISPEMWRELNKLYWQLRDPEFTAQARESPHDFYRTVEVGSHLLQGICDATVVHDEGWYFIQLGKHLERADKTLRILDAKYGQLQQLSLPVDLSLANLMWGGVLKTCLAYEAYQRRYLGRVESERVVELLLLDSEFPRSVRFCLETAVGALRQIEGSVLGRTDSPPIRLLGRVLSDFRFSGVEEILDSRMHPFLESAISRCSRASWTIQEQYTLS